MVAASGTIGLVNPEDMKCEYEVRVWNTFIHVVERPPKRRMSAPAALAVPNFDTAVAQDIDDGKIYSLDDYISDGESEACDSTSCDSWDERSMSLNTTCNSDDTLSPREMQDEAAGASDKSYDHERGWNSQTIAVNKDSASDVCAHSDKGLRASGGRESIVDGSPRMAQGAACKSRGARGSKRSKAITKMFIGNLPCSMSNDRMEAELCKHGFFGTYTSVNIPRKGGGIGRGFGFVTFCSAEEAQRFASVFRGCEFEGHRCYVNPAAQQSIPCTP
eukprot:TRINITY_DN3310_c0_g1_i2.p1 TRINITY_DN3310_c0_g1~~TRINITY_DN3310_c0_g1_i2.p1  ORF type:complete len:275 (-),score=41.29 TRINITY_DN3310_c0_g1_i2:562-1386(-)